MSQVCHGGCIYRLISFGSGRYGYVDRKRLLHYLPWDYTSDKQAASALRRYVEQGKAKDSWFIRKGDKPTTIDYVE